MSKKSISKEIRRTRKVTDENCYVCDEELTETHHIVKVSVLTGLVMRFNATINELLIPVVALCPNHHTKWHILAEDFKGECEVSEEEKEKYLEIVDMAEYDESENEYSESYNYAVDEMTEIISKNLEEVE